MPLVSITEMVANRTGEIDSDSFYQAGVGGGACQSLVASGRYVRTFIVITDCGTLISAKQARDAFISTTIRIPYIGESYPGDSQSVVVSKEAVSEPESPEIWRVTVSYDRVGSPLTEPWEVDWNTVTFTEAATKDTSNNGITNSAGDPFDPPIERDNHRKRLTISRNKLKYDISKAFDYEDSVNDDVISIGGKVFPAGTLKCVQWVASRFQVNGLFYWRETITVEYDPNTWSAQVVDAGYRDDTGQTILDPKTAAPYPSPTPLNGAGVPLTPGSNVIFLTFNIYPQRDFSVLDLNYGGCVNCFGRSVNPTNLEWLVELVGEAPENECTCFTTTAGDFVFDENSGLYATLTSGCGGTTNLSFDCTSNTLTATGFCNFSSVGTVISIDPIVIQFDDIEMDCCVGSVNITISEP